MKLCLEEKIAIVTGAGSGIGAAVSRHLAEEGAEVVVADINADAAYTIAAAIRSEGGRAREFVVDVGDSESVQRLVDFTVETCGGLDLAVNNAGIDGMRAAVADYPLDNWHEVMNVNLNGVFYCMKSEIGAMLKLGGGAIVNMSSTLGTVGLPHGGGIHSSQARGCWTDESRCDGVCEAGYPHKCRRSRLDRNATFVRAS